MTEEGMELVTLDKSLFEFVMDAIGFKEIKCSFCGDKITKENFGLIAKEVQSCNNIFCLIKAMEYTEDNEVKKE